MDAAYPLGGLVAIVYRAFLWSALGETAASGANVKVSSRLTRTRR
jgi:hypothetical protein